MTKLELIELRNKGNINESISLVNYYTKDEKGVSKINYQIVEDLLIEYLLYGKYDLVQELIKVYDKHISNTTLQKLLELIDSKMNNVNSKEYKKRLNYFTGAHYSYRADSSYYKLVNFLISSSKAAVIPALKISILKKAENYDVQLPSYLLGMYYKKLGKTEESIKYLDKSANHYYRPAALELIEYYKDDYSKRNYYMTKAVLKTDKNEIFDLINALKKDDNTVKDAYNYLLDNIYSYKELRYELATWYENGVYIEENKLFAYILYLCCDGYNDSKEKVNVLNKILKEEYKEKIDLALEEDIIQDDKARKKAEAMMAKKKEKQELLEKELSTFKLDIDRRFDGGIRRGEKQRAYNKKVKLYEQAWCASSFKSALELLKEASELDHTEAQIALFNYHKAQENYDTAREYLVEASKKSDRAKQILKDYDQTRREEKKQQKNQEQDYINNIYKESKTNPNVLKEMFYKANSDYDTEKLINRTMVGKKLPTYILNIISEVADEKYEHANLFLFDYYRDVEPNLKKKVYYIQQACANHNLYAIKKMFLHCYINDIKNTYKYFSKEIIDYVVNLESNDTDIIYFQAVILGDDDICEIFEVEQNEKLSLEKLLYVYYERGFCYKKENIAIMISSYYEHGKGVQKDLSKALEYMDSVNKNSIGSIRLRKKIEDEKNRAIRDPKNIKLTQEYSNKTFDTYLENNPDFKQQIEKRYLELDTKELEKELICRNELLDDNYEIPFIYRNNKFLGFSIKLVDKIQKEKENEL